MSPPRNPNPPTLGERELDIMQALWHLDRPTTVTEVHQALVDAGHDLAYTTVQTMLNRLEAKGQVRRDARGRAHRYAAAIPADAVAGGAVARLVRRFFDGSAEALATRLVRGLDRAELERVQEQLESARKEMKR